MRCKVLMMRKCFLFYIEYTDVNECDSNPCKEGTACVNKLGTYTCECDNGWEGKNCTNGEYSITFLFHLKRCDLYF